MATAFNLTAQLNLQGPSNIRQIVSDVKKQLGTISADVKFKIDPASINNTSKLSQALQSLDKNLASVAGNAQAASSAIKSFGQSVSTISSSSSKLSNNLNKTTKAADNLGTSVSKTAKSVSVTRTEMEEFGRQSALAIRRFAAFSAVTGVFFSLNRAINSGLKSFIEFDRQLVRLQQVTGKSAEGLRGLQDEISRLSIGFGVSSDSLIQVSSTLAQAGLSANETKIALEALAKTELAPSFDNINQTVEGSIALMRQFSIGAKDLEKALGSVNSVAAAFAVESGDIIAAIQRTGGVFASASKGVSEGTDALNEFIAVFTSVRATTRESAETIATGLRTIFTRVQRASTIEALREFGVSLTDAEGKFVGAYKAVELLSQGLNRIDPRDLKFSQIVEELGGFRQIGKVIPLIQQFSTAQEALKVAQGGQGSLAADAAKAQLSLANQIAKVREEFLTLIRGLGQSDTFQTLAKGALGFASGLIKITSALKGVLPALAILGAGASLRGLTQFTGGFLGGLKKVPKGEGGEQQGVARSIGSNLGSSLVGVKTEQVSRDLDQNSAALDKVSGKLDNLTASLNSLNSNFNSINSTLNSYNSLLQQSIASLNSNTSSLDNLTNTINNLDLGGGGATTVRDGGKILGFNRGGVVPGSGKGDKVRALLEPGEVVMSNSAVNRYGRGNLVRMNKYVGGGGIFKKQIPGALKGMKETKPIAYDDISALKINNSGKGSIRGYFFENFVNKKFGVDAPENKFPDIPNLNAKKGLKERLGLTKSQTGRDFKAAELKYRSGITPEFDNQYTPENTAVLYAVDKNIGGKIKSNFNKYALGGKTKLKGSNIIDFYPSLQSMVDPEYEYYANVETSKITPANVSLIANMIRNKRKNKDLLGWQNFELALSQSYGLYPSGSKKAYLDFPKKPGEAKFLKADAGYSEDNEDGIIKGNNNETMLAKLIGEGLYKKNKNNKVTAYYPENPRQISGIIKSYADGDQKEKKEYGNIKLKLGGLIQKFMAGSPDGVEEPSLVLPDDVISYLKPFGNVGDITRTKLMELLEEKKLENATTDSARTSLIGVIKSQIESLGGIKGVKPLVGRKPGDTDLNNLLRSNSIGSTDNDLERQAAITNQALEVKGVKDAEYAARIAKMTKVGVVGLIGENNELNYSKTFDNWDIGKGRKVFATVKGLQSKYIDAYIRLQQDAREAKTRFQENLQHTDIFTGDPLVFDFDETLVTGADILTKDKKPDYPKYSDRTAVEQALSKAKLTRLGTKLKSLIEADPEFINQTRILTARPQSTADLLASKLQQLGLPYSQGYITGVSQDVGKGKTFSSVAEAKTANLGTLEKLIDDNLENIQAAQKGKRQTFLYRNPEVLGPEYDEKFGQGNIEGSFLEAALAELGANLPPIDKLEQNRAVDFPNGLGPAAQFFGIDPTIPTEVKRRLNSDSFERARGEFGRYYDENPDKFNIGGLVQRFMAGGEVEAKQKVMKLGKGRGKKGPRESYGPRGFKILDDQEYESLRQQAYEDAGEYGGPLWDMKHKPPMPKVLAKYNDELWARIFTGIDIPVAKPFDPKIKAKTIRMLEEQGDVVYGLDKIPKYMTTELLPFRYPKATKEPKRRIMDRRVLLKMTAAAGGVDASALKDVSLESLLKFAEQSPRPPKDVLDATAARYESDPEFITSVSGGLLKVWESKAKEKQFTSIQPLLDQLPQAKSSISDLRDSLVQQLETTSDADEKKSLQDQIRKASVALTDFDDYSTGSVPKSAGRASQFAWAMRQAIPDVKEYAYGGLVSSFNRGGYSRSPSKLVPNDPTFERSQTSSSSGINYTSILENSGLNLQRELIYILSRDARTLGYTPDELLERAKKVKDQITAQKTQKTDRASLAASLMPTGATPEQIDLAKSLMPSRFASGGTVPALVSNGEAYVPPKVAQRIGYGTLNKMNQADKNGMGRFSKGGVSVFKGPGTGTSDSIPTSLPVGSFIIREKATKALGLNKGGSVGVQRFANGGAPSGGGIGLYPGLDKPFGFLEKNIIQIANSFKTEEQLFSDTMRVFSSIPPGWERLTEALDEYGSALENAGLVTLGQQNLMIRAYAKAIDNLRATGNAKAMIEGEKELIKSLQEAKDRISSNFGVTSSTTSPASPTLPTAGAPTPPPVPKSAEQQLAAVQISALEQKSTAKENVKSEYDLAFQNAASEDSKKFIQEEAIAKYEAAKATIESSKASQEQAILQDLLAQKAKENSLSVKDYISSLQDEITTRALAVIEQDGGADPTQARQQAVAETISSQGLQAFNVPELSSGNDLISTMSNLSEKTTSENNLLLEADKAKAAAAAIAADELELLSILASQSGVSLKTFKQNLEKELGTTFMTLKNEVPKLVGSIRANIAQNRDKLTSSDDKVKENATKSLGEDIRRAVGSSEVSKISNEEIDKFIVDLQDKLQDTSIGFDEAIKSVDGFQKALDNASSEAQLTARTIEAVSASSGASKNTLDGMAEAAINSAKSFAENEKETARLSTAMAKQAVKVGLVGSALSSVIQNIGGSENKGAVVAGAAVQGASSTFSTLTAARSQALPALDAASAMASKMGGPIGKLGTTLLPMVKNLIAGPVGLLATGAIALAGAFKDAWNAARDFDLNQTQKRLDQSISRVTNLFDEFSKDSTKLDVLDRINKELSYGSQQLIKNLQTDLTVPKAFWMNLLDVGGGAGAAGRSMILEKEGSLSYIQSLFSNESQQKSIARLAPEKAVETAQKAQPQGQNILRQFENRLRTGENIDDILSELKVAGNETAEVLARMNPKINEQIMLIQNDSSLSSQQQQAQVKQIVATEANRVATINMKNSMKQLEFERLEKQTNNFAASLERMFNNMEQAINKVSFDLDKLSRSAELSSAALSGNAKAGNVMLDSINVLQNPRAYSGAEQGAAFDQAAGMFGSQAGLIRPLLGLGDKLESTVMRTINSSVQANPNATTEGIAGNIRVALDKQLRDLGLPPNIADKLAGQTKEAFAKIRSKGDDTRLNFDQVVEEVPAFAKAISSAQRAQELANKAMEFYQKNVNEYAQSMNQMVDYQIEANSRMRKATEIQAKGNMELSRTLGKRITLNESRRVSEAPIRSMTGGLTDARDIGRNVVNLENTRRVQQGSADSAANRGPSGKDEFMVMQNRLRGTNTALRENIDALKQMADSTELAQAALQKIQEVQAKRQAGANLIEKMVTSSPEELARLNASIGRLNNNMRGGLNVGSTSEQRGETLQAFNMLAPLLGDGQQQNELRANVLESMLKESGLGIDSTMQGVLDSLRDPEGDPQMAEAISVYRESLAKQTQANTVLAELQRLMSENTAEIAATKLATAISGVKLNFEQQVMSDIANKIQVLIDVVKNNAKNGQDPLVPQNKQKGGIIYASMGQAIDFAPKGTDTVPAMLTPGEFVVNRAATKANLPLLHSINNGYSNGGKVKYYEDGGYVLSGGRAKLKKDTDLDNQKKELLSNKQKQTSQIIKGKKLPILQDNYPNSFIPMGSIQTDNQFMAVKGTTSPASIGFPVYDKIVLNVRKEGVVSKALGVAYENYFHEGIMDRKISNRETKYLPNMFIGIEKIDKVIKNKDVLPTQYDDLKKQYESLLLKLQTNKKRRLNKQLLNQLTETKLPTITPKTKTTNSLSWDIFGDTIQVATIDNITKPYNNSIDGLWGLFQDEHQPQILRGPAGVGFADYDNPTGFWSFLGRNDLKTQNRLNDPSFDPILGNDPSRFAPGLEKVRAYDLDNKTDMSKQIEYANNTLEVIEKIKGALYSIGDRSFGAAPEYMVEDTEHEDSIKLKDTMAQLDALYNNRIFSADISDTDYVSEPVTLYNVNDDNRWKKIFDPIKAKYDLLVQSGDISTDNSKIKISKLSDTTNTKDLHWISKKANIDPSIFAAENQSFTTQLGKDFPLIEQISLGSENGKYFIPAQKVIAPFIDTTTRNYTTPKNDGYIYIPPKAGTAEFNPLHNIEKPIVYDGKKETLEAWLNERLPNWNKETKTETDPSETGFPKIQLSNGIGLINPIDKNSYPILKDLPDDKIPFLLGSNGGSPILEAATVDATVYKDSRDKRVKAAELNLSKQAAEKVTGARFEKLSTAESAFTSSSRLKIAQAVQRLASAALSNYGIGIPSISKIEDVGGVAGYLMNYLSKMDNRSIQWAETNAWRGLFSELFQPKNPEAAAAYLKGFGVNIEQGTINESGIKNIIAREKAIAIGKNVSGDIPENDLKNLDLETTKTKLYTVGADGKKTEIKSENIKNPKTVQDVEKIALAPENLFENSEKRQSYLKVLSDYFTKNNLTEFSDAVNSLKTWYNAQDSLLNASLTPTQLDTSLATINSGDAKIIESKSDYDPANLLLTGEKYGSLPSKDRMIDLIKVRKEEAKTEEKQQQAVDPANLASGGLVYASNGTLVNYQPRGTDTVPAMLTPGEFVINRDSTNKYRPVLEAINNGSYSSGGIVNYLKQGGYIVPKYLDNGGAASGGSSGGSFDFTKYMSGLVNTLASSITEAFDKALSNIKQPNNEPSGVSKDKADLASIDNFVNRLNNIANILSNIYIPPQITITGKHDVVVTINGDTVLNQLRPDIAGIVVSAIRGAFADLKAKNPENNTINFDIDINANRFSGNA